jgi:hypothetical protein
MISAIRATMLSDTLLFNLPPFGDKHVKLVRVDEMGEYFPIFT